MRKLFGGARPNRTLLSAIAGTWLLLMSAGGIAADAGRLATKLDAPLRVFAERPDTAFKLYPDRVQFEQGLASSRVPHFGFVGHTEVPAAGSDLGAIGTERHTVYRARVPFQFV